MKNIMLIGVSRSGKSTFARMLKEKYPEYNIIHGDMIKKSYEKNIDNSKKLREVKEYRNFLKDIFHFEHTRNEMNYILDTVDIYPSDIEEYDKDNTIIIAFGYTNILVEELLDIWKSVDNKWIKNMTDEELIKKAENGLKKSKQFQEECKKHVITYIDTSKDRKNILEELLNNLDI